MKKTDMLKDENLKSFIKQIRNLQKLGIKPTDIRNVNIMKRSNGEYVMPDVGTFKLI